MTSATNCLPPSTSSGEVWTGWLPTSNASVTLRAEGCGQARGFRLVEALPQWGAVHVEARGESTANPYPADGQRFQVSLGTGGYVKLTNVTVASCDEVEARAPTGEVLWRWKPAVAWAKAWSGRLSGDVEVGIWGAGCNATERKGGFTLAEVRLEEAAGAPLPLGLPGQKQRPDGTWDNWHRTYMAEMGRYLAPEPLQQSPADVMSLAFGEMQAPAYAYAASSPLRMTDASGLYTVEVPSGKSCDLDTSRSMLIRVKTSARRITDDCLRECVLERLDKMVFQCGTPEAEARCRNEPNSIARAILGDSCKSPALQAYWCNRASKLNESCVSEALVHEAAHSCGWKHKQGKGVPGPDGHITTNCSIKPPGPVPTIEP